MLKFFRHIRRSLINPNHMDKPNSSTGNYLKYAIGEVLLVMVGILLALQVNNWNESNKRRTQEIKIYKEILSDLELTAEEVNKDMEAHISILDRNQKLLEYVVKRRAYSDSISGYMTSIVSDLQVYPKTSGYDALNSIGLDLLSNDRVRIEITNLYQLSLQRVVNAGWRETPTEDIGSLMEPFMVKHMMTDTVQSNMRTINYTIDSTKVYRYKLRDYDALLNDDLFKQHLNLSILKRTSKIQRHARTLDNIKQTVNSIVTELRRLED